MTISLMESPERDQWIEQAQSLAEHIQQGDDNEVHRLLDELSRTREHMLFQELGKLTREFHEALNDFRLDSRITHLARENIPDAKQRLNYVIVMTEQAANRTLTAVESSIPLCEKIISQSRVLREQWLRFTNRALSAADFRSLSRELDSFLEQSAEDSEQLRENLSEVLMAQDYQDITGQILQRVIRLVNEMEEHLVHLVQGSGRRIREVIPTIPVYAPGESEESMRAGEGPYIPGASPQGETVQNQDDVDSLLSDLGF